MATLWTLCYFGRTNLIIFVIIILNYNVIIKIFFVAENYTFLGSSGSWKIHIRTFDTGARLQRITFCGDTLYDYGPMLGMFQLLVMHTQFASKACAKFVSKACALERLYSVEDNLVNKLRYVTQNRNLLHTGILRLQDKSWDINSSKHKQNWQTGTAL